MLLRIAPDDIDASARHLGGDSGLLRGLSALMGQLRAQAAPSAGPGPLGDALDQFLAGQASALAVLAETTDLLATGLGRAAGRYRETESLVAGALGSVDGRP